jgi:tRNA (guanine37-N1)-methyltransferase
MDYYQGPIHRPANYNGWKVPEVLTSGNFAKIDKWHMAYEHTKNEDLIYWNKMLL